MPWVEFESMIPAVEQSKTFLALDCAATVIGYILHYQGFNIANVTKKSVKIMFSGQRTATFAVLNNVL
jgi:hypothetical protein